MLYSEIIAVCSQIHTKDTNTLCGQNVQFGNAKLGFRQLGISHALHTCRDSNSTLAVCAG